MATENTTKRTAESLLHAVDRTIQATLGQAQAGQAQVRVRAGGMLDEVSVAASRVKDALDDLRAVAGEDARQLRDRVTSLELRLARLEELAEAPTTAPSGATAGSKARSSAKAGTKGSRAKPASRPGRGSTE